MANSWITHVKQYAKSHNVSYKTALKNAKSSYTKSSSTKRKTYKKRSR